MAACFFTTILLLYAPPKITNSTSTDATFAGAWCNSVVAKQEDCHPIAAGKLTNK